MSTTKTVFWSFKGGHGRTLTMANMTALLARLGHKVVCLDLDLDSPGLPGALQLPKPSSPGFVEYAFAWLQQPRSWPLPFPAVQLQVDSPEHGPPGSVHLISAGDWGSDNYWKSLVSNEFTQLYHTGALATEFWRDFNSRIEELEPDYLLVDTRSGLTDLPLMAITRFAGELAAFIVRTAPESIAATSFFLPRLQDMHPKLNRTVITLTRRPKRLTEGYIGSGTAASQEPDDRWLERNLKALRGIGPTVVLDSDWHVEASGRPLIPLQGRVQLKRQLFRDYMELAAGLFPQLGSAQEIEQSIRDAVGLKNVEAVGNIKVFEIDASGDLRNVADGEKNIAFRVATLQRLLDSLWMSPPRSGGGAMSDTLKAAGAEAGKEFGLALRLELSDRLATLSEQELATLWCDFDSDVGFGRLVPKFAGSANRATPCTIEVSNNSFAFGRGPDSPDLCQFLVGYIESVTTELMERHLAVTHELASCIRAGAAACSFKLDDK